MTTEALLELLESTGLPVVYRKWLGEVEPPYVVYLFTEDSDMVADNVNYHAIGNWQVELYSRLKDTVSEAAIESALQGAAIPYQKIENYLESEDLVQVLYIVRTL